MTFSLHSKFATDFVKIVLPIDVTVIVFACRSICSLKLLCYFEFPIVSVLTHCKPSVLVFEAFFSEI